jgi:hypothetical protein
VVQDQDASPSIARVVGLVSVNQFGFEESEMLALTTTPQRFLPLIHPNKRAMILNLFPIFASTNVAPAI